MSHIFFKSALFIAGFAALTSFSAHAANASPSTTITITNNSNSTVSRNGKINVTGIPNNPIPASITNNSSSNAYHAVFTSSGATDAGVLYYGSCRFNWSTTNLNGWHFSQAASPSGKCSAKATTQNPKTGEHAVEFTIN